MSTPAALADTAAAAARVPGVAWASPIGFASGSLTGSRGRQLTYLVGYDATTGRGGPTTLIAGRGPRFGEAVLDRALADARFLEHQLTNLTSEGPRRTAQWAKDAIAWFTPEVCWATTSSAQEARELEADVERLLRAHGLWNRPRNLN